MTPGHVGVIQLIPGDISYQSDTRSCLCVIQITPDHVTVIQMTPCDISVIQMTPGDVCL